jgi:hypothetical protein
MLCFVYVLSTELYVLPNVLHVVSAESYWNIMQSLLVRVYRVLSK